MIGAVTTTQSADAKPSQPNQAAALVTQPATINSQWNHSFDQNNLKQTAESIPVVREQGCKTISPLELLNDAEAVIKECEKPTNNPIPRNGEPVEYLKVPRLDSGLSVTVSEF
jgi:hypothetical protein